MAKQPLKLCSHSIGLAGTFCTDPDDFFHRLGRHLVNDLIELEVKIVTQ